MPISRPGHRRTSPFRGTPCITAAHNAYRFRRTPQGSRSINDTLYDFFNDYTTGSYVLTFHSCITFILGSMVLCITLSCVLGDYLCLPLVWQAHRRSLPSYLHCISHLFHRPAIYLCIYHSWCCCVCVTYNCFFLPSAIGCRLLKYLARNMNAWIMKFEKGCRANVC